MKVIFLDINGVLSIDGLFEFDNEFINKDCLNRLVKISNQTNAKIVLSSTWRLWEDTRNLFGKILKENKLELVGYTKDLSNYRADEISEWLSRHPEVENFAIIDDKSDAGLGLEKNYFKTRKSHGLTDIVAEAVIEHLNSRK